MFYLKPPKQKKKSIINYSNINISCIYWKRDSLISTLSLPTIATSLVLFLALRAALFISEAQSQSTISLPEQFEVLTYNTSWSGQLYFSRAHISRQPLILLYHSVFWVTYSSSNPPLIHFFWPPHRHTLHKCLSLTRSSSHPNSVRILFYNHTHVLSDTKRSGNH